MELTPGFDLRRLVIVSNEHSTMEFTFDHIERNVALSLSLFHFVPPPGTEIIEQP
jgi:outer membrane lipoprotein-sorting protein